MAYIFILVISLAFLMPVYIYIIFSLVIQKKKTYEVNIHREGLVFLDSSGGDWRRLWEGEGLVENEGECIFRVIFGK